MTAMLPELGQRRIWGGRSQVRGAVHGDAVGDSAQREDQSVLRAAAGCDAKVAEDSQRDAERPGEGGRDSTYSSDKNSLTVNTVALPPAGKGGKNFGTHSHQSQIIPSPLAGEQLCS